MPYTLGAFTFPSGETPGDGELEDVQPQKWSEMEPIGASNPGTLLTYISSPSTKQRLQAIVSTASKNSLKTIFAARTAVTWITPDDPTGISVLMTELSIRKTRSMRGTNRWECSFTLVSRAN